MRSIRRLPVICGYGGINSAGRSAFDLAYKRLVFNLLSEEEKNEVFLDLSNMTDGHTNKENMFANTLVRKINKEKQRTTKTTKDRRYSKHVEYCNLF